MLHTYKQPNQYGQSTLPTLLLLLLIDYNDVMVSALCMPGNANISDKSGCNMEGFNDYSSRFGFSGNPIILYLEIKFELCPVISLISYDNNLFRYEKSYKIFCIFNVRILESSKILLLPQNSRLGVV